MKKRFSKVLCILLTFLMICTAIPTAIYADSSAGAAELTASTEIEEGSTYTISSMDALKAFKSLIESGQSFSGATVVLTKDIEMSDGTSWTAIGASRGSSYDDNSYSKMKPFSGTFDGQGYSLNDPSFVIGNKRGYGMGFFGRIDNAVVKNLNIKNVSFTSNSNYGGFYGLGCIAGYATGSTIENCYVDGTPTFSLYSTTDVKYAGSIVGSATKTDIIDCTSALNINFTRSGYAVGGIAGYVSGGSIRGCINKGMVGSRAYDSNGGVGTGGIVGKLVGGTIIDRCINEGTVNNYYPSAYTYYSYTGGIVGQVNGSGKYYITNCWNKGNVNGLCQVGGIIGLSGATNSGTYYPEYAGTVSPVEIFNCLNTGKVGRYGETKVPYGGGMVGSTHTYNGVFVENCYNQGNVQPESSTTSPARAFIGYGTTGESSYSGSHSSSRKPGDYTLAYITHSYSLNYNDGGGTTSMRPYTQCRSSAVGYSDCVSNYLAQSKEGAAAACADLNSYAAKDTDWSAVLVPDFKGFDPYSGVEVTENGKDRDYVEWIYDKSGAVNNGLPYLDLMGIGYDAEAARPVTYTVTYTDGVDGSEIFADQTIENILEGSETPAFEGELKRDGYAFVNWSPEVSETVTEDVTYTAIWEADVNGNGVPDKDELHQVVYRDGIENEDIFDEEKYEVLEGNATPAFEGELKRDGYVFVKWSPEISETVTDDVTYTAVWEADVNGNGIPDRFEVYFVIYRDGANGTVFDEENFETLPGMVIPVFIGDLIRDGYVFAGWDVQTDDQGNIINTAMWNKAPGKTDGDNTSLVESQPEPEKTTVPDTPDTKDKPEVTEKADEQKPEVKVDNNANKNNTEKKTVKTETDKKSPNTGAEIDMLVWSAFIFVAAYVVIAAVVINKRREELE